MTKREDEIRAEIRRWEEEKKRLELIRFLRWFTHHRGVSDEWFDKIDNCVDSYLAGDTKQEFMAKS